MALLTACDASKGNEMEWFDHAVKTAGCITCVGDTLNVRIYEHIKDEEQYAENLFTGTKYAEYNVDKNTGDVEKVE